MSILASQLFHSYNGEKKMKKKKKVLYLFLEIFEQFLRDLSKIYSIAVIKTSIFSPIFSQIFVKMCNRIFKNVCFGTIGGYYQKYK